MKMFGPKIDLPILNLQRIDNHFMGNNDIGWILKVSKVVIIWLRGKVGLEDEIT